MRRALLTLLAAPALLLGACSDDDAPTATTDAAPGTPGPTAVNDDAAATADPPVEPADEAQATATQDPADAAAAPEEEVMGGEEGQAAADRAKEFLMALVTADPEACGMLLSFSDAEVPMREVPSDLELCQTQLPATMEATVDAQGLGEDGIAVLETMQIRGADVQGDTAVVGRDNYSPLFAEAMGDDTITLRRVADVWYVDLDAYLQTD